MYYLGDGMYSSANAHNQHTAHNQYMVDYSGSFMVGQGPFYGPNSTYVPSGVSHNYVFRPGYVDNTFMGNATFWYPGMNVNSGGQSQFQYPYPNVYYGSYPGNMNNTSGLTSFNSVSSFPPPPIIGPSLAQQPQRQQPRQHEQPESALRSSANPAPSKPTANSQSIVNQKSIQEITNDQPLVDSKSVTFKKKTDRVEMHATSLQKGMERIAFMWDEKQPQLEYLLSLERHSRIFETIALVFEFSSLLDLPGNAIRLALKESSFCFQMLRSVFDERELPGIEQAFINKIRPIINANSPQNLQTALAQATFTSLNTFSAHEVERVLDYLIRNIGQTEAKQKASLQRINRQVGLIGYAVGQIIGNLPQDDAGIRLVPHSYSKLNLVLHEAMTDRNEFAHSDIASSKMRLLTNAGEQLIMSILQHYTKNEDSASLVLPTMPLLPVNNTEQKKNHRRGGATFFEQHTREASPISHHEQNAVQEKLNQLNVRLVEVREFLDLMSAYEKLPSYQNLKQFGQSLLPTGSFLSGTVDKRQVLKLIENTLTSLSDKKRLLEEGIRIKKEEIRQRTELERKAKSVSQKNHRKISEITLLINKIKVAISDTAAKASYDDYRESPEFCKILQEQRQKFERLENKLDGMKYADLVQILNETQREFDQELSLGHWKALMRLFDQEKRRIDEQKLEEGKKLRHRVIEEQKERARIEKSVTLLERATQQDCQLVGFNLVDVQRFVSRYRDDDSDIPSKDQLAPFNQLIDIIQGNKIEWMDRCRSISNEEIAARRLIQREFIGILKKMNTDLVEAVMRNNPQERLDEQALKGENEQPESRVQYADQTQRDVLSHDGSDSNPCDNLLDSFDELEKALFGLSRSMQTLIGIQNSTARDVKASRSQKGAMYKMRR